MSNIWIYFILGMLGLLLQTSIKITVLKQQSKVANHIFSFKEYLINDWPVILGSIVTVVIAILALDEYLPLNSLIGKYVKIFFAFVGYTGSSLLQVAFSMYNKKLMALIDIKTNIADGKKPPVDAGNIEGVEEIKKDKEKLDNTTNT